jgi:hypothetical protein
MRSRALTEPVEDCTHNLRDIALRCVLVPISNSQFFLLEFTFLCHRSTRPYLRWGTPSLCRHEASMLVHRVKPRQFAVPAGRSKGARRDGPYDAIISGATRIGARLAHTAH